MLTCPKCGTALPPDTRFCPRDGTTVREDTIALTTGAILAITPSPPPNPAAPAPAPVAPPAPVDSEHPLLGRVIDGRYAIRKPLGKGAVGAVYEGELVELKKAVALKVLNAAVAQTEEFQKRFEREARSASRLSHPGCVSVLDFGHISRLEPPLDGFSGVAYLVMELVRGELLSDRIERGRLPPAEALKIARGVLSALRHAHGLEIVHRDVKPANIMLAPSDEGTLVKLLDFGLAKSLAADSPDGQLTQMGMVFGTPGYLSPEQASRKPVDARSDLYSLGVVLFEMVCGRPPFDGDNAVDVVRDHLVKKPPSPRQLVPAISTALEAVILKSLAKDPVKRFPTAESFQAALETCPEASPGAPAPIPSPSLRDRLAPILGQDRRIMVAAAAVAALLIVGVLLISRPRATPPAPTPMMAATPMPISNAARKHLRLAADHQQKLWCADAVEELERALREEPALRTTPEVTRIALPCLRAKTQAKTVQFLVENVGAPARPELEAALAGELKPDVREGVERALARLPAR